MNYFFLNENKNKGRKVESYNKKMNIKRIILGTALLCMGLAASYAQISIGSYAGSDEGALLSLKQNDNSGENSNSGLLLPRVNLEDVDELYPMFDPADPLYTQNEKVLHTGLTVYNLTTDLPGGLCPGPYSWDGRKWKRLWGACTPPVSIRCGSVYVTGYVGIDMASTPAASTARIEYELPDGGYELDAAIIGTQDGVTAYVEAQTLSAPSGYITVRFSGTPSSAMDKKPFLIDLAGNTCSIYLSAFYPPASCAGGSEARGFVFRQNDKWHVVTINKSSSADAAVQTIECASEEEALRHPEALQYCGVQTTNRCIPLFDRNGDYQGVIFKVDAVSKVAQSTTALRCWENFRVYSGSQIQSINSPAGYLGAASVSGGKGYLGITNETVVMTTNALR